MGKKIVISLVISAALFAAGGITAAIFGTSPESGITEDFDREVNMGKKIAISLVISAAFFAAGGITAAIFGTSSQNRIIKELEMYSKFGSDDVRVNEKITEKTEWSFAAAKEIGIATGGVKTNIVPSENNEIGLCVDVKSGKANVKVMEKDGRLAIGVDREFFSVFFGVFSNQDVTVTISLPREVYDETELRLGSGSMEAGEMRSLKNTVNIGSGKFMYSMAKDFAAEELNFRLGSGSAKMSNIAAVNQNITVSSGDLEFDAASGAAAETLKFVLSSGDATLKNVFALEQEFNVSSGDLVAHIAGGTADSLKVKISSGWAEISGAAAAEYDVKVSSGDLDISGLTGSGRIDVTSGDVEAEFTKIGNSEFGTSSGSLDITIPSDTKANFTGKVTSGSIVLDACGVSKKIRGSESCELGGGGGVEINAKVTSGEINIVSSDEISAVASDEITIAD